MRAFLISILASSALIGCSDTATQTKDLAADTAKAAKVVSDYKRSPEVCLLYTSPSPRD